MRYFLLILAVAALVGCGESKEEKAAQAKATADAKVIEAAIRNKIKKHTGELTKTDLEKVTLLDLSGNQLTDAKGLKKLTQLKRLYLEKNPDLTKVQIDELKEALPKCKIYSYPKK